jgi:hypothetical protein
VKTISQLEAGLYVRSLPIDIRFRVCQNCGRHKPTKGGSIRVGKGLSGGSFVCADCKPKPACQGHD